MKRHLISQCSSLPWKDLGPSNEEAVDYPDFAAILVNDLKLHLKDSCGVLVCGSGQGMVIAANRSPLIRAALCWNEEIARLALEHNDANVLFFPGRHVDFKLAERILDAFLKTPFAGGRHQRRVDKLNC